MGPAPWLRTTELGVSLTGGLMNEFKKKKKKSHKLKYMHSEDDFIERDRNAF